MPTTVLIRRILDTGRALMGALFIDSHPICFVLEDSPSVIGPGTYNLKRVKSPKFGDCYTIAGVPGHDLLRIHWGNGPEDTDGCLLLGFQLDAMDGGHIWASKAAFNYFMESMADVQECDISFVHCY